MSEGADVNAGAGAVEEISVSESTSSQSWSFSFSSSSVEVAVGEGAEDTSAAEVGMGKDWDSSSVEVGWVDVEVLLSSEVVPSMVASAPAACIRATASVSKSQLMLVPGLLTNGRAKHFVPPLHGCNIHVEPTH